jgi:hypothetical protein
MPTCLECVLCVGYQTRWAQAWKRLWRTEVSEVGRHRMGRAQVIQARGGMGMFVDA